MRHNFLIPPTTILFHRSTCEPQRHCWDDWTLLSESFRKTMWYKFAPLFPCSCLLWYDKNKKRPKDQNPIVKGRACKAQVSTLLNTNCYFNTKENSGTNTNNTFTLKFRLLRGRPTIPNLECNSSMLLAVVIWITFSITDRQFFRSSFRFGVQ